MNDTDFRRAELEALSNEELLGAEYLEKLREQEIEARLDNYLVELEEMTDEEFLGEDFLQEMREDMIEEMLLEEEVS